MRFEDIDRNPDSRKLRWFGLLCLVMLAAIGARRGMPWLAAFGALAGLAALVRPALLRPLFVGASIAAFPFGWLISRLILAAVFFAIVTPLGFVSRIAGRDRLRLLEEPRWIDREMPADPRSYFRQF